MKIVYCCSMKASKLVGEDCNILRMDFAIELFPEPDISNNAKLNNLRTFTSKISSKLFTPIKPNSHLLYFSCRTTEDLDVSRTQILFMFSQGSGGNLFRAK